MPLFRKKPVVISAEQWRVGEEDVAGACRCAEGCRVAGQPHIHTLEGVHHISDGDFVITGVKGERYPCKPDIFAATYEPAEEQPD